MAVVAYAAEARSITGSLDGPAHDDAPAEPIHVIRQILESGRRETFVLGDLSRRGGLSSSTRGLPRPTLDSGVGTVKLEDEPGRRQVSIRLTGAQRNESVILDSIRRRTDDARGNES